MDALSSGLQFKILWLVSSINDLTACRRVNRKFKQHAEVLLGTVEHVDVNVLNHGIEETCNSLSLMVKQDLRQFTACLDCDLRGTDRFHLLLAFLKQFSPSFISIHVPEVIANLIDLEPIATGMIYFCFERIISAKEIDADVLHNFFPNLIAYDLGEWNHKIDLHEVFEKYSHDQPQRFINCPINLTARNRDRFPQIVIPSARALLVEGRVNILKQLSPCALDFIKLMTIYCYWPSLNFVIQLRNLFFFTLHCGIVDTNELANFLATSSRLKLINVAGQLKGPNDVLAPLRPHMLEWHDLSDVSFGPDTPDARVQGRADNPRNKPLCSTSIEVADKWNSLSLWSAHSIIFKNSPVVSSQLKKLSLDGPMPNEFEFIFPNLLSFTFRFSSWKQKVAWLIRCLKSSKQLEKFTLEPTGDSKSNVVRQVDYECIVEFLRLFEMMDSLNTVLFCPCEIYNPPSSKEMGTLDLRSRERSPIYFEFELYNYPVQVILPSHVSGIRLRGREKYISLNFRQTNDLKWRRRESVFKITVGVHKFSFDEISDSCKIEITADGGRTDELKSQIESALQ